MDFDELKLTKRYCQCTEESENKCPLCSNDLPFIDSPYGAIPTLVLMKDYIKQASEYIKAKIEEMRDGAQSLLGPMVARSSTRIQEMQDEFTEKIDQKIMELDTRFDETVTKKMEDIDLTYTSLKDLSNSLYQYMHEFIMLINEMTAAIFSLLDDFNDAKDAYITTLQPMIKEISDSLSVFNKILPSSKIFLTGPLDQEPSTVFSKNANHLSRAGLKRNRDDFTSAWNKLIVLGETSRKGEQ